MCIYFKWSYITGSYSAKPPLPRKEPQTTPPQKTHSVKQVKPPFQLFIMGFLRDFQNNISYCLYPTSQKLKVKH